MFLRDTGDKIRERYFKDCGKIFE